MFANETSIIINIINDSDEVSLFHVRIPRSNFYLSFAEVNERIAGATAS